MVTHAKRLFPLVVMLSTLAAGSVSSLGAEPVSALQNAHAHNDYAHKRPLFDALDQGFCSVEADIFLVDGELLVAHTKYGLKPERTLEKLYLAPLKERIAKNGGKVYPDADRFVLLVDIKEGGEKTYAVLHELLDKYKSMFTTVKNGTVTPGAVTVIISGDCPKDYIAGQQTRYAGIDGRLSDLDSDAPAHLLPLISDHWGRNFSWFGRGPMPANEKAKLKNIVEKAHAKGRIVRFWAIPHREALWAELQAAGVDLINADDLARLRRFLVKTETGTSE